MIKTLKECLYPTEPEMPDDVALFLETDFGKKVKDYFMATLDFILSESHNEAYEMLDEERKKVKKLKEELSSIKGKND